MIKTLNIETGKFPSDPGPVYDYAALESLDEFKTLANEAMLIILVDKKTSKASIVFGTEILRAIANKVVPPQALKPLAFAIDVHTSELEHLLAAVTVTKGFHEYK